MASVHRWSFRLRWEATRCDVVYSNLSRNPDFHLRPDGYLALEEERGVLRYRHSSWTEWRPVTSSSRRRSRGRRAPFSAMSSLRETDQSEQSACCMELCYRIMNACELYPSIPG